MVKAKQVVVFYAEKLENGDLFVNNLSFFYYNYSFPIADTVLDWFWPSLEFISIPSHLPIPESTTTSSEASPHFCFLLIPP